MPSRSRTCPCHKASKQDVKKLLCQKNAICHEANENNKVQSNSVDNATDTFVVHNTEDLGFLSVDLLQSFGHYKIYCPRCQHLFDKAKRRAGSISKFNKSDMIRICQHCSKKLIEVSYKDSNKEVKQLISTKYLQNSKQNYKTVFTKIRQLLKDVKDGETNTKKSRPHTYSEENILSLDHGLLTHTSQEPNLRESNNLKPGIARTSKHELSSDFNVLKPSSQKHVHLKSQNDVISDDGWSMDDYSIDSEELYKLMLSKRGLPAAEQHHKRIITGKGSKNVKSTGNSKEDSKIFRPAHDFTSTNPHKGLEDPRNPATASSYRLAKQFYKRRIIEEERPLLSSDIKSDMNLIDLKHKNQPTVRHKLKFPRLPRDDVRKPISNVDLGKVTSVSSRKYNSAEALYSSASAIDDAVEKNFKYYFHKDDDKIVKKPVRQISSPELIKNTLDIINARAEKERIKLEDDRRKKEEERENKRIARENKRNERLQKEEAKGLAREKEKFEKELEHQKEEHEYSRKKRDRQTDKGSLVKLKDKKQSKVAAITSTQQIKTKHSKQNVSNEYEMKHISSKDVQLDKNKKYKEDQDSGQLDKEKDKIVKENPDDAKEKTKQEIKEKGFQKLKEDSNTKKDTDKVAEKDIHKSEEGADAKKGMDVQDKDHRKAKDDVDVKKNADQIKEKDNKESKQTQTVKETEEKNKTTKKTKDTVKPNAELDEKKDIEKDTKGTKETKAPLKELKKSDENIKSSKKTKESSKPTNEENDKDAQKKKDDLSAAQDFQKLLAEQAKQKEADLKQRKIREEEERKAREATEKLKLETPEAKAKKIGGGAKNGERRKSFLETDPKNANKDAGKELSFSKIKMKEPSTDDLIWELVRLKQASSKGTGKEISSTKLKSVLGKHRCHKNISSEYCIMCCDSDIELDIESLENRNLGTKFADIIIGENILRLKTPFKEGYGEEKKEVVPILFKSVYENELIDQNKDILLPPVTVPTEPENKVSKPGKETKTTEQDVAKGVIRYALSNRAFIEKGWTLLPTEKVVRKMNVYRMRPAHPEFDWFEHNKSKGLMLYDSGEKLAEFDDKGRGRWFYRSGKLALDYYDAEESNAQQRFVIYSSGEPDERGRSRPFTILATFDYLGNGIVFDHAGKIRLKYNQTEGVILDRSLGPVSHWKWHTLNDPPVLQQVMIDTQMSYKDPDILKLGGPGHKKPRPDNEEMLAIEFDNFIKEKSKKLTQTFKPFQIKMKALKINEQFSLKVLDQATIYLIFRDGTTNLKLNLGMILDHKEIVDTDTAEVGEVSNNVERLPARTNSIAELQIGLTRTQHIEKLRVDRERRLRPAVPTASVDRLTAAMSRPLRQPFRTASTTSNTTVSQICKCKKPSSNNVYYDTRLI